MERLIFVLSVSLGSVALGYVIRRAVLDRYVRSKERVKMVSKDMKLTAMFVLNPIPIVSSFWGFTLVSRSLISFPFLGILCTAVGGISALIINALLKIPPKQAASVFTSGMFSNIVTFGGLTAFVFFGADGYVLILLFNLFIVVMYYMVGFPISEQVSQGSRFRFSLSFDILKERPYIFVPIISIAVGLALNGIGLSRPHLIETVSSVLIPLISGLLGFSIGITLYIGRIQSYVREILLIMLIKFGISPMVMTSIGLLIGLQDVMGGMPFKILVISSAMPVAFNSLLPPAIYGFDLDLANSAWVVTTFSYLVILPILYLLLAL